MVSIKGFQIRHKLFLVFVLSNILLIVSMWQVFQWSFDRGFVTYATERDRDFLQQMANRTANLYIYYDDWYFLVQESRLEKSNCFLVARWSTKIEALSFEDVAIQRQCSFAVQ